MYHFASDLVATFASVMDEDLRNCLVCWFVCLPTSACGSENPVLAHRQQVVDEEEEEHHQGNHDENHGRREPGFLPRGPCDLLDAFAPDFPKKLDETRAPDRCRNGQAFARAVRSLFGRVGHVDPFLRYLAGVEGLEPTTYGFGDRRSTN